MGAGFVIFACLIVGTVLAGLASAILGGAVFLLTRGVSQGRNRVVLFAVSFPLACLVWLVIVFAFQAFVSTTFLDRDIGVGDCWTCPLPNGYRILMIDTTSAGCVYNPQNQTDGGVTEKEDAPFDIRLMQVAGRYILGGLGASRLESLQSGDPGSVRSYFLLDTHSGTRTNFADYESLQAAATRQGIELNLEPIADIYARFARSWFDVLMLVVSIVPPMIGFAWLVRRVVRLRRSRTVPVSEGCVNS